MHFREYIVNPINNDDNNNDDNNETNSEDNNDNNITDTLEYLRVFNIILNGTNHIWAKAQIV